VAWVLRRLETAEMQPTPAPSGTTIAANVKMEPGVDLLKCVNQVERLASLQRELMAFVPWSEDLQVKVERMRDSGSLTDELEQLLSEVINGLNVFLEDAALPIAKFAVNLLGACAQLSSDVDKALQEQSLRGVGLAHQRFAVAIGAIKESSLSSDIAPTAHGGGLGES